MAIQPFAMQAQTAQFNLPSEALAGGERLKGLQNQNAMMAGEMQDKQNLDQAYRESGGDINAMMKNPNLGFEAGTKLQSLSSENVKAQAAAKAANIDQQLKMLDAGAQVVGGATDQASWDAARQQMGQMFGEEAMNRLPAQYDPNAQRTLMEQSMSFKDKLDLQRSQLQMQREERMAGQQDRMYQLALNRDGRAAAGGSDGGGKVQYDSSRGGYFDPSTRQFVSLTGQDGAALPPRSSGGGGGGKLTDSQVNSAMYGARSEEADRLLTQIGDDYRPVAIGARNAASDIPLVGGLAGMYANKKLTANEQMVEQAQRDFVTAVLRKESGATISPEEFKSASQQYFPQPNDSDAVKAQKARNRQTVIQGLKVGAGAGAYSAAPPSGGLSGADAQAMQWAQSNPDDPRAAAIMQRLGGR